MGLFFIKGKSGNCVAAGGDTMLLMTARAG